jgi:iron(III) transport system ATP-binding protein
VTTLHPLTAPPDLDTVITVRDVRRLFGTVRAVDGVDLDIHRGKILALLGPSGCGKTTMLRLLAGFERPDTGTIAVDGRDVAATGAWVPPERRRIGMVFQEYALFPHLDVAGNVAYGLAGARRLRRKADPRRRRVAEVLDLVGLAGLEHRYPHELSGGQQQRVALARALAPEPAVVLLDEPFSNLDAGLRGQVRADVHRILSDAGATAVFVTHDQEEALAVADEVAVMREGRIAQLAAPELLYRRPADRNVAAFVGDAEFLPGVSSGTTALTEIGPLHLEHAVTGDVDVLVRPEDLHLAKDPDGDTVVLGREFYGHDQMLFLRLATGRTIRARLGPVTDLAAGDRCRISVPGVVHAYPR